MPNKTSAFKSTRLFRPLSGRKESQGDSTSTCSPNPRRSPLASKMDVFRKTHNLSISIRKLANDCDITWPNSNFNAEVMRFTAGNVTPNFDKFSKADVSVWYHHYMGLKNQYQGQEAAEIMSDFFQFSGASGTQQESSDEYFGLWTVLEDGIEWRDFTQMPVKNVYRYTSMVREFRRTLESGDDVYIEAVELFLSDVYEWLIRDQRSLNSHLFWKEPRNGDPFKYFVLMCCDYMKDGAFEKTSIIKLVCQVIKDKRCSLVYLYIFINNCFVDDHQLINDTVGSIDQWLSSSKKIHGETQKRMEAKQATELDRVFQYFGIEEQHIEPSVELANWEPLRFDQREAQWLYNLHSPIWDMFCDLEELQKTTFIDNLVKIVLHKHNPSGHVVEVSAERLKRDQLRVLYRVTFNHFKQIEWFAEQLKTHLIELMKCEPRNTLFLLNQMSWYGFCLVERPVDVFQGLKHEDATAITRHLRQFHSDSSLLEGLLAHLGTTSMSLSQQELESLSREFSSEQHQVLLKQLVYQKMSPGDASHLAGYDSMNRGYQWFNQAKYVARAMFMFLITMFLVSSNYLMGSIFLGIFILSVSRIGTDFEGFIQSSLPNIEVSAVYQMVSAILFAAATYTLMSHSAPAVVLILASSAICLQVLSSNRRPFSRYHADNTAQTAPKNSSAISTPVASSMGFRLRAKPARLLDLGDDFKNQGRPETPRFSRS